MKRIGFVFFIATLFFVPGSAQRYGQLETDILYAHRDYETALLKGDVEKLDELYATEYIRTTPTGELVVKEEVLKDIASGRVRIETLDHDYERTRGYGDTGIVNIIWTITGKDNGKPFTIKSRVSIFYVNREGRWRIVAEQFTPIKEQTDTADLEETLIDLERGAWEAWKTRDVKFFRSYIVGDPNVAGGMSAKAAVFKTTGCTVNSYSLDNFKMKMVGDDKATLNYRARQNAVCKGKRIPPAVSAATLFVKRGELWQATFHDESPIK